MAFILRGRVFAKEFKSNDTHTEIKIPISDLWFKYFQCTSLLFITFADVKL